MKLCKILSLLLAGLLAVSGLTACSSTASGIASGSQTNSDKENAYQNLSPAEVYRALQTADDYRMDVHVSISQGDQHNTRDLSIEKDSNRVKGTTQITASQQTGDSMVAYFDMNAGTAYGKENGVWTIEPQQLNAKELVDSAVQGEAELLFGKDNYKNTSGDTKIKYMGTKEATDAAAAKRGEDYSCTLSMEEKEGSYCFLLGYTRTDEVNLLRVTVTFQEVNVTLPTVGSAEDPADRPAVTTPAPSTGSPAVPDTPGDGYLAPSDLYAAICEDKEQVIEVRQGNSQYRLSRCGQVAYLQGTDAEAYYDLQNGIQYTRSNGKWAEQYVAYDWSSLLQAALDITHQSYYFNDRYYQSFDGDASLLTVQSMYLVGGGLTAVTLERSASAYTLTECYQNGTLITVSFRLNESTDLRLPN